MRVILETDAGETADITATLDGRIAAAYLAAARRRGWPEARILDEIGGWEETAPGGTVEAHDGIIKWATGAEVRGADLVLYQPDFAACSPWGAAREAV